jgi:metal-responsive CopG/Arc/MetJ family transcriptional regulator
MPKQTRRTTIAFPEDLLRAVDQAVQEGKAESRNELIAVALRHELAALERAEIDVAFAEMSRDRDYQEESRRLQKSLQTLIGKPSVRAKTCSEAWRSL